MHGRMESLVEEIVNAHLARATALTALRQAADERRGERARGLAALRRGTRGWLHEVASRQRDELSRGRAALGQADAHRREENRGRRAALGQADAHRREESRGRRAALGQADAHRREETRAQLGTFATARGHAAHVWGQMTATLRERRAGGLRPQPHFAAQKKGATLHPAEEASSPDRVFAYLAAHPDGMTLSELEKGLGLNRFEAARRLKQLIKDGKAEKRDLRYFAI